MFGILRVLKLAARSPKVVSGSFRTSGTSSIETTSMTWGISAISSLIFEVTSMCSSDRKSFSVFKAMKINSWLSYRIIICRKVARSLSFSRINASIDASSLKFLVPVAKKARISPRRIKVRAGYFKIVV